MVIRTVYSSLFSCFTRQILNLMKIDDEPVSFHVESKTINKSDDFFYVINDQSSKRNTSKSVFRIIYETV